MFWKSFHTAVYGLLVFAAVDAVFGVPAWGQPRIYFQPDHVTIGPLEHDPGAAAVSDDGEFRLREHAEVKRPMEGLFSP